MNQRIANISLLVTDYDEAIQFYTEKLNFKLLEDTRISADKRWVRLCPPRAKETCLLLAKADDDHQLTQVGNQCGGRVFLFLFTDDFERDYQKMNAKGVEFLRIPKKENYGTVAVFKDLYGNLWDLIQPNE